MHQFKDTCLKIDEEGLIQAQHVVVLDIGLGKQVYHTEVHLMIQWSNALKGRGCMGVVL